ncbi:MAG: hypothetical protein H0V81_01935 [Solirubrobacterales bacterium]|nr:hypothetical protein [Solirubrobacterales bacterium]
MRRCIALITLALLLSPASAMADGDPASDVLLAQDIFLPYAPNTVSPPVAAALKTTVERARKEGYAIKIALIADARDLGSVGQLLNKPQDYANLLTQEISLNVTHGDTIPEPRVLTVQPAGLGGNNLGDNAGDALEGVLPEQGAPDELARTAAVAVGKLAAAEGKPIDLPELPAAAAAPGEDGGGLPAWLLYTAPVLLVGIAIAGMNARMSRVDGSEEPAATPESAH